MLADRINSTTDAAQAHSNNDASSASLNLLNLHDDTVRIEAFYGNNRTLGHGYQSSGTIMSEKGEIITADHHMVSPDVKEIDVMFANGTHRSAKVVASDGTTGLAMLKLVDDAPLPIEFKPLQFGSVDNYSPSVLFGYQDHEMGMGKFDGVVGEQSRFDRVNPMVLQKDTPNLDRKASAEHVYMNFKQGVSGGFAADRTSGKIFGLLEFGINARLDSNGVPQAQEALLTKIDKVLNFYEKNR